MVQVVPSITGGFEGVPLPPGGKSAIRQRLGVCNCAQAISRSVPPLADGEGEQHHASNRNDYVFVQRLFFFSDYY
jgi:hypothetical protein